MQINKKGFTLIEILVVVLIIGVLAAVAIPGYRKSIEKAKAAEAVAVINDAAKAEQDFALASSRYTSYWDDLIVNHPNVVAGTVYCLKGANTANQNDCGNDSSYKIKLTVNDNNNSVVMATRMPNNPYADYKLFKFMNGDPNIYCKAATTSPTDICSVLGFPTHSLPKTRNIDRETDFRCADELSCNGATNGCLGGVNPDDYSCHKTIFDDGSYNRYAYYENGDLFDVFTYDANDNLTSDTWFDTNGEILGTTFFENGVGIIDFTKTDSSTGQDYDIRIWEEGHWSELTGFYPNGSINNYRSWDNSQSRWAYFVQYNEDGSVKKFTCYTDICGGSGSCTGAACDTSAYSGYIPNPATLKTYDQILTEDRISQICENPNNLSFC